MKHLIQQHKQHLDIGGFFIYSDHLQTLETPLRFDHNSERKMLIESTSNLYTQHGGDTDIKSESCCNGVNEITTTIICLSVRGSDQSKLNYWQDSATKPTIKKSWLSIAENTQVGISKNYSDTSMYSTVALIVLLAEMIITHATELRRIGRNRVAEEQQNAFRNCVYNYEPIAFITKKEVFNA